jgi:ABC-2 type transport system permease protein
MPQWAQIVTWFNPVKYLIDVMRLLILKGSGFAEIRVHILAVTLMAIVLNTAAVLSYRKTR